MDIQKYLKAVFGSGIKEPCDLFGGTISATDVGAVRGQGPVTDGKTDDLNVTVSKSLDEVFGDPGIPMSAKDGITFLGTEGLAESKLVHADTF